jgi:protein kinase C substrate 80K-H
MVRLALALGVSLGASAAADVRGVPQSRLSLYGGASFSCVDGSFPLSSTIDARMVNDNYCDCADGSDEPGTAACAGGHFYCRNRGHLGKYVPSAVVNDGVCDCCDGSDEYGVGHGTTCADTCVAAAASSRAAAAASIRTLEAGALIKVRLAADGAAAIAAKRQEVGGAAATIAAKSAELAAAQAAQTATEVEEAAARAEAEAEADSNAQALLGVADMSVGQLRALVVAMVRDAPSAEDAARAWDAVAGARARAGMATRDDPTAARLAAARDKAALDAAENGRRTAAAREAARAVPHCAVELCEGADFGGQWRATFEALPHGPTDWAAGEPEWEAAGAVDDAASSVKVAGGGSCTAQLYEHADRSSGWQCSLPAGEYNAAALASRGCHGDAASAASLSGVAAGQAEHAAAHSGEPAPAPELLEVEEEPHRGAVLQELVGDGKLADFSHAPAEAARSATTAAQAAVTAAESVRTEAQKELEQDFGEDSAFWSLKGQSIEMQLGQYTYKVAAYDAARQDSTSLGSWKGWDGPAKADGSRVMKFEGGSKCWNGPQRSMAVTVKCGVENALVDVAETSTCVYVSTMITPAACDLKHAQKLNLDLSAAESAEPPHPTSAEAQKAKEEL